MVRRRATSGRLWIGAVLGIALLAHVVLLAVIMATGVARPYSLHFVLLKDKLPSASDLFARTDTIDVDLSRIEPIALAPSDLPAVSEADRLAEVEEKIDEAKKPEEDPDKQGQVVEIAPPAVEVRPDDDAKFLSEYDQKVTKETKANGATGTKEIAIAQPPIPASSDPTPPAPPKGKGGLKDLSMRGGTGGSGEGGQGAGTNPAEAGDDYPVGEGGTTRAGKEGDPSGGDRGGSVAGGGEGDGTGDETVPPDALHPSEEVLAKVVGEGSSDYLKDVDEGEETLLNTKRWKYASFFNRVKRAVADNWHPDIAWSLRDPTGQIYGQKNRLTILKVSLEAEGSLKHVDIEKSCGVDFLDDEAVSAFRAAEPFPNPPDGLIDAETQLITFRFGFYFEVSSKPSFRVFRYGN